MTAVRPTHCTAVPGKECWECYQPWITRTTERQVSRALLLVKGRCATITNETESIAKIEWAVQRLRGLHNDQWRDMIREPFNFSPAPSTAGKIKSINLADLGLA